MIKAIIFDCFGVLVGSSLERFYEKYLNGDTRKIEKSENFMFAANKGEITHDEFVNQLSIISGLPKNKVATELDANPRNIDLLDYIKNELKPNYKIGFLSNASDNWLNELFLPEDIALFDTIVVSYETGYAKPEAQIYEIAADRLGVRLDECIFVDDREEYIEGAVHVGMQTILYQGFPKLKKDLGAIL